MSTSTYFTPPEMNPACNFPVVCAKPFRYVTHTNGTVSGTVEVNTDVSAEFGGRKIVICKTTRKASYSNSWTLPQGCFRDYASATSVSESLKHESSEIMYVNNQHNVVLYRKFTASVEFIGSGSDYIGTTATGGYPMIGKVCVTPTQTITEQIILSRPSGDEVLHDYATTQPGGHYLILVEVPDPLPEPAAKALDADPDIKSHGGYYSGNWLYPPWIEAVMGKGTGRDAIWYREYIDQSNPT